MRVGEWLHAATKNNERAGFQISPGQSSSRGIVKRKEADMPVFRGVSGKGDITGAITSTDSPKDALEVMSDLFTKSLRVNIYV
jgi:hypothetical protein